MTTTTVVHTYGPGEAHSWSQLPCDSQAQKNVEKANTVGIEDLQRERERETTEHILVQVHILQTDGLAGLHVSCYNLPTAFLFVHFLLPPLCLHSVAHHFSVGCQVLLDCLLLYIANGSVSTECQGDEQHSLAHERNMP